MKISLLNGFFIIGKMCNSKNLTEYIESSNIFSIIREESVNTFILEFVKEDEIVIPDCLDASDSIWMGFKTTELNFSETGILTGILKPIADIKVSVLVISSYDRDYIFVEKNNISKVKRIFMNSNLLV